jgi:mRNA interferase MazF
MTGLNRGDVVLVWFPNSDLVTFKRRPALVVEADNLATVLDKAIAGKLGRVKNLARVDAALRRTLGL